MADKPRHISKAERAFLDSKKVKKDPVFKKCDGCGGTFFEEQVARFGRQKGSPLFCGQCAQHEFDRLKKQVVTIRGEPVEPPKGIIE